MCRWSGRPSRTPMLWVRTCWYRGTFTCPRQTPNGKLSHIIVMKNCHLCVLPFFVWDCLLYQWNCAVSRWWLIHVLLLFARGRMNLLTSSFTALDHCWWRWWWCCIRFYALRERERERERESVCGVFCFESGCTLRWMRTRSLLTHMYIVSNVVVVGGRRFGKTKGTLVTQRNTETSSPSFVALAPFWTTWISPLPPTSMR